MMAVIYGDLLNRVLYRVRPYEKIKGSANLLAEHWMGKCIEAVKVGDKEEYVENIHQIVKILMNWK